MRRLFLSCLLGSTLAAGVAAQTDYPGAWWYEADDSNYTTSWRTGNGLPIDYVIIHVVEGSFWGCISWFQNPVSNVSAHYVVRQSDGQVAQMVRHKDIGWHAGNWWYNQRSIGIEHEGWHDDPDWNTPALLRGSADLTRWITTQHDIPRTRDYILGHYQVAAHKPNCPGPFFKWDTYMQMVQLDAAYVNADFPLEMYPGQQAEVVIRFDNTGDLNWSSGGDNPVYLGTQSPQDRASEFYTPGDWLSPNRIGPAGGTTSPGARAEFRFVVTAPMNPGNYNESFQLVKEGVTWFGPVMSLNIEVTENTYVVDNVQSTGTGYIGGWRTGAFPGRYGDDYRWSQTNPGDLSMAIYHLNAPGAGYYDVYAWWNQGTNRSTEATFEVVGDGSNPVRRVFDQTSNGSQWNLIERVYLPDGGGFVRVLPTGEDGRVVIADAVRVVGPFESPGAQGSIETPPVVTRRVPLPNPDSPPSS